MLHSKEYLHAFKHFCSLVEKYPDYLIYLIWNPRINWGFISIQKETTDEYPRRNTGLPRLEI